MAAEKKFIVVTGGNRSGKSSYAQKRSEKLGERRIYLATAESGDAEMETRIEKHQSSRDASWSTVEEPLDPASVIKSLSGCDVLLLDCLTIWLSNLMLTEKYNNDDLLAKVDELGDVCRAAPFNTVLVTNEVGSGIIPMNALSRRFADLSGEMNQRLGAKADSVVLAVAGIPLALKGEL